MGRRASAGAFFPLTPALSLGEREWQAALAFERARLRENDLGEAEKARQLAAAIGGLTAAATKVAVLAAFIDALPALGAQTGSLALIGEDGTTVDVQGGSEASPYLNSEWLTRPIGARTPLIAAVRTGDALFIHRDRQSR